MFNAIGTGVGGGGGVATTSARGGGGGGEARTAGMTGVVTGADVLTTID